jgi:hypothetical protein
MRSMMAVLLDRLDAEDPAALTDAELGTQIVQLRRLLDGLEARWLRRLAAFDRRGAAAAAGAVSTGCILYTTPSPRDSTSSRKPTSA